MPQADPPVAGLWHDFCVRCVTYKNIKAIPRNYSRLNVPEVTLESEDKTQTYVRKVSEADIHFVPLLDRRADKKTMDAGRNDRNGNLVRRGRADGIRRGD